MPYPAPVTQTGSTWLREKTQKQIRVTLECLAAKHLNPASKRVMFGEGGTIAVGDSRQ
jgi:hypothetical protein